MDYQKLTARVEKIVRKAARLAQPSQCEIREKDSPINIVTSADLAVQQSLVGDLSRLIPGSGFLCEENHLSVTDREFIWVIDPIDGTMNFSRGIPCFSISVGLLHHGDVVAGVVYAPALHEMYTASLHGGAFLNGRPIRASQKPFSEAIFYVALSLYRKDLSELCLGILRDTYAKCNDFRRSGSCALEMCHLALGRCDLFFEMRVFPWDYAAGSVILSEAGGKATSLGGAILPMDRPSAVIGANTEENHRLLSEIVSSHVPTVPYEEVLP